MNPLIVNDFNIAIFLIDRHLSYYSIAVKKQHGQPWPRQFIKEGI